MIAGMRRNATLDARGVLAYCHSDSTALASADGHASTVGMVFGDVVPGAPVLDALDEQEVLARESV